MIELKIKRAEKHTRELQSAMRSFQRRNPYAVLKEIDPETGERVFILRIKRKIPPQFSIIVGDIVHNLRSSLDHLYWQLILANKMTPTRNDSFPIFDREDKFDSFCTQKTKTISSEAMRMMRELKPYKGGNDSFWNLHQLSIIDKHRFLVTVGCVRKVIRMGGVELDLRRFAQENRRTDLLSSLVDGAELFRGPYHQIIDDGLEIEPNFAFDIAFGESGFLEGETLISGFKRLSDLTRSTICCFGFSLGHQQ